MLSKFESCLELVATIAAVLLIPVYMGFIHVAPVGALAYAGVGGAAMAAGEELQFREGLGAVTLWDIVLWALAISGVGGLAYLLALIAI
jgi:hypothetical protein